MSTRLLAWGRETQHFSSPGRNAEEQDSSQCYFTWRYKLYLEEPKDKPLAGITAVSRKRLWRLNYGPTCHTGRQWERLALSSGQLCPFCTASFSGHRLIASFHFDAWKIKSPRLDYFFTNFFPSCQQHTSSHFMIISKLSLLHPPALHSKYAQVTSELLHQVNIVYWARYQTDLVLKVLL